MGIQGSQHSNVNTVTGYGLDDSGFLFWQVQKIFLSSKIFSPALGPTQTYDQ